MLLTHIAMSHELQRGTKRTAVLELPLAQQMRAATAVETPSYQQQQQQWQCMQMQPLMLLRRRSVLARAALGPHMQS